MKDIAETFDYGLDFVNKLKPIQFRWKKGGVRTHFGLNAHDVGALIKSGECKDFSAFIEPTEKTEKFVLEYDEDNLPVKHEMRVIKPKLGLRMGEFIAPMIKAIQDLNAIVDKLTARVAVLEK